MVPQPQPAPPHPDRRSPEHAPTSDAHSRNSSSPRTDSPAELPSPSLSDVLQFGIHVTVYIMLLTVLTLIRAVRHIIP
ncbi:hypothetical protein SAMN06265347_104109 [Halobellus salinus]|nr:hypothetical protein SAMN06265347_104109 [Halobellus salinus]